MNINRKAIYREVVDTVLGSSCKSQEFDTDRERLELLQVMFPELCTLKMVWNEKNRTWDISWLRNNKQVRQYFRRLDARETLAIWVKAWAFTKFSDVGSWMVTS